LRDCLEPIAKLTIQRAKTRGTRVASRRRRVPALDQRLDKAVQQDPLSLIGPTGDQEFKAIDSLARRSPKAQLTPQILQSRVASEATLGFSRAMQDRQGVRVGVVKGSTSETNLPIVLKNAKAVAIPTIKEAPKFFFAEELDAFATNKPILHELADELPGSQVLAGRSAVENVAIAISKGRELGHAFLRSFTDNVKKNGTLGRAVILSGSLGSIAAE
jgi:polar amino acid transport system substrate-binding protein